MTRDESRITSFASSSSGHSSITVKPSAPSRSVSVSSASNRATPKPIKTGDHGKFRYVHATTSVRPIFEVVINYWHRCTFVRNPVRILSSQVYPS
ncbi:hypothetical protein F4820DRAFT_198331 [Hypoxylon rubiginosum]|uniref:Uncharacterized protein n=1 Tax=Hypoxylon rubiginosum TaxID=110542 RepID=A0ACB9Z7E8_9PEZI|nr:hypothetical protein F4820DRAFT_198331 [Hypoxylon rubiginosum]